MSIDLQTSTQPSRTAHKLLSIPNGSLFEIVARQRKLGTRSASFAERCRQQLWFRCIATRT
jgi:hypothetical protein